MEMLENMGFVRRGLKDEHMANISERRAANNGSSQSSPASSSDKSESIEESGVSGEEDEADDG